MIVPRPLSALERAVLEALLPQGGFADADVYRTQLEYATVTGTCSCGCPTIDLSVGEDAPTAQNVGTPMLPLYGTAGGPTDPDDCVDVSVWAPEGRLTELNVAWYGRTPPAHLPDPRRLVVRVWPPTIYVD